MGVFQEQIGYLAAGRPREYEVLRLIVTIQEGVGGNDPIEDSRSQILRWAEKRAGTKLPVEAYRGETFEYLSPGRNCAAVRLSPDGADVWALRQEDPDKNVPRRSWAVEIVIWTNRNGLTKLACRLYVVTTENEFSIVPHVPGFVMQLAQKKIVYLSGLNVSNNPWQIGVSDDVAVDRLIDLLTGEQRDVPVVVCTPREGSPNYSVDVYRLAKALTGLAFIACIDSGVSYRLTEEFDKKRSVFSGAVRIYYPNFDSDADPYSHPLFIFRNESRDEKERIEENIIEAVAKFSTTRLITGHQILPFAELKSASLDIEREKLRQSGASDEEQLRAANAQIRALKSEIEKHKQYEALADEYVQSAEERAEDAERRARIATNHLQNYQKKSVGESKRAGEEVRHPKSWSEFANWVDENFAGRVILTSQARRRCKKALYADVDQVVRCIDWLASDCRDRFLDGGGSLRDENIENGLRNAPCGGDEFQFLWSNKRMVADWHIKTGGNSRAPENCLRIYYGWDSETSQIIIADLPAHRENAIS